jgi:hypothetical protein
LKGPIELSAPLTPLPKPEPRSGVLLVLRWLKTSDQRFGFILRAHESTEAPALAYTEVDGLHPTAADLLSAEASIAEAIHNYLWTVVGVQLQLDLAGHATADEAIASVRGAQSP